MESILYTIIIYPLYLIIELSYQIFVKLCDGNKALPVIGVSIAITLLCLPLYAVAEKWQELERQTQKKLQPGIDRIKKAFTGDERYMMTTTFYKENHYHPLMALRSSFGLLIQVPFFIAAYSFLSNPNLLSGVSLLFIKDMGKPDALFSIGSFTVNILPITMTLINIIAGAIYTHSFKLKDKLQIYGMALLFLVILYNSPSGLVLYWTMNNVFSLIKNIFYKLKNPLKAFYYCSCIVCAFVIVYFAFFLKTKHINKVIGIVFCLLIYCIPLFAKACTYLLDHHLKIGLEDKKLRLQVFFLSCLITCILTGLAIPSALISSDVVEFSDIAAHQSPYFLFGFTVWQSIGFCIAWPLCIYFLFGPKIQTFLSLAMCIIAIGTVMNAFGFMLPYGDISQSLVFLNPASFRTVSLPSLLNLLAIIALIVLCALFVFAKKGKVFTSLLTIGVLSLSAISIVNIITIVQSYNFYLKNKSSAITQVEPIFHLSKNHPNVVLFMLDRGTSYYIPEVLEDCPELKEVYSGFTLYQNVLSFNGHTLMGSPGLFGGYEYTPAEMNKRSEEPLKDKHNEALLLLPRIFTEQAGYKVSVADPSWANYNNFSDLTIFEGHDNIKAFQTMGKYNEAWFKAHPDSKNFDNTEAILKRNLLYFSFFREVPIFLRQILYHSGSYWNSDAGVANLSVIIDSYAVLDFLPQLTDFSNDDTGSYIVMSNELTHEDMYLQAPEFIPVKDVTNRGISRLKDDVHYPTHAATLKRIASWLQYLKDNGVYDNTRIIMVSDHGVNSSEDIFDANPELDNTVASWKYHGRAHYHSIMMYKDFNTNGTIKTDMSFMTNADTPSLLVRDIVPNATNPFTNKPIPTDTTSLKKDGVYITVNDNHQPPYNGKYTYTIKDTEWWHVKDSIFKSENWNQQSPFSK
ncbi:MAG: YidC/Oxa1 family membrane protein insertase [Treponema sp.]|nr:YidC/Oxa1 family membrane protein insertase [Treponema sp.]